MNTQNIEGKAILEALISNVFNARFGDIDRVTCPLEKIPDIMP